LEGLIVSEIKFTPGPWMVSMKRFDGVTAYMIYNHIETAISCDKESYWASWYNPCTDYYGYYQPDHNMDCDHHKIATARLIAAAPELFDVLERLEESSEYWSEYFVPLGIVDDIKNVLKKARGEQS
jgi:hypothetical protein